MISILILTFSVSYDNGKKDETGDTKLEAKLEYILNFA
jgi:hypothetical protein